MQVRPHDPTGLAALVSARPVVPEPGEHAPERLGPVLEIRPSAVVLEAGQRLSGPFALQQDIPDHAPLTGDGMEREETAPGQLRTGPVAVVAPEQLVAAAHGEEGRAAGDRVLECRALGFDVGCDERLLAILAAADVVEVDLSSVHALADADRGDLELMAASCGTLGQHGDVAAVGVDVQIVRVEMPDADLHAARSQYGRANPRSETIFRSASMAV